MPLFFLQTIQNNCSFLLHRCNTKSYSLMEGKYISWFYEFTWFLYILQMQKRKSIIIVWTYFIAATWSGVCLSVDLQVSAAPIAANTCNVTNACHNNCQSITMDTKTKQSFIENHEQFEGWKWNGSCNYRWSYNYSNLYTKMDLNRFLKVKWWMWNGSI